MSNHLTNVLVTLRDKVQGVSTGGNANEADYYEALVASANDYYPFGLAMPGRKDAQDYRYGFNGKENDKDWGTKFIQDYGFRLYNPSIAKFLSVDPLSDDYPWYTPYQFAGNKPIISIDLDGLEDYIVIGEEGQKAIISGPFRDIESAQSQAHRNPSQVSYLLPEVSVSARKVDNGHSSLHGARLWFTDIL